MKREYILKRLDDTPTGEVNCSWRPKAQSSDMKLISWNWDWIQEEASKLKVGETKIYEVDV